MVLDKACASQKYVRMHSPAANLRTSAEAAEKLGIDRSTLSRWVQSKRLIPAIKLPGLRGAFMFTDEAIEAARVATPDEPADQSVEVAQ